MAFSNAASDISGDLVSRYRSTATAFAFAVELAGTFMSASTSSTTCSTSSLWSESGAQCVWALGHGTLMVNLMSVRAHTS